MNEKMNILKNCWKYFVSIAGAIAIIAGLFSFADRYVTRELLAKSLDEVNKSIQYQFNANRYSTLTDQSAQIKILLRKNPKDQELKDELDRIEKDKLQIMQEIRNPKSTK